jgi:nucleotide-binding universal stress UspA family protein
MAEVIGMPGIIVGVDGSGHSQRALEWAMREAGLRHAPLTVLTVHETYRGWFGGPVINPEDAEQTGKAGAMAQAETDEVLARLDGPQPESVKVLAVHGFPVEELIKAGEHADMIVLGSRGAGGFARLTMGSVTTQVAHHASCPVLIVPAEHHEHHA